MFHIRQNATHKVVIGPVVAVGDGFTPITNLVLTGGGAADEAEAILHDNGTVIDISGYTWAAIVTADGYYHLTLQAAISGTVGHLTVLINDDSLCLPVRANFTVMEEAAYDAMYKAAATGPALATDITTANSTLENHLTDIKGTNFVKDTHSLIDILTAAGGNVTVEAFTSDAETQMDEIQAKANLLGTATVEVTSPITSDADITIVAADDYYNAESRSIEWTNADGDWGTGDDITSATVTLYVIHKKTRSLDLEVTGSVITATGTQLVRVELTTGNTEDLTALGQVYEYQLVLVLANGHITTVAEGDVTVTQTFDE